MTCKMTKSLDSKACNYAEAGARSLYLANWYKPVYLTGAVPTGGEVPVAGQIGYRANTDGFITGIVLPTGEDFFTIGGADNTIAYQDQLLAGANGAKYRQHTVNAVVTQDDIDVMTEGDAISLGRFIAVVVGNSGNIKVLGRTGGITAPAAGWDFASGAATADANGWTLLLQGTSGEIAPLVLNEAVITPIAADEVEG